MSAAQWLADAEAAPLAALEAVRAAQDDARRVRPGPDRGDLASSLVALDHHVSVARGATSAAMRAAGVGTAGGGR